MLSDMIPTQWIRLLDDDGRYIGSLDPVRGVLMSVKRGGTAVFDLPQIIAEWHKTQGNETQGIKNAK